jgi:hypothetical protein
MSTVLTDLQLDTDCAAIVAAAKVYSSGIWACVSVLYATGCREAEVLDRARWAQKSADLYELQPQKSNAPRLIKAADLSPVFIHWIAGSGYPSALASRNNLRRISRTFSIFPPLFCGSKGISSHRFRHNRIRQLYAAGKSTAEIMAIFGLSSPSIVTGYGTSALYY